MEYASVKRFSSRALAAYFAVTIILSAVVDICIARGGPDLLYPALMWCPALGGAAGVIIARRARGEARSLRGFSGELGFRRCPWRYVLWGAALPMVYLLIPYVCYWIGYPGSLQTTATNPVGAVLSILIAVVLGDALSLLTALGEEIGWRGVMVPALYERLGLNKTLLLSGAIWCLWHFPLLIFDDYMSGTTLAYQLISFVLCIFPVGVLAGLLAVKSRSVWPSALLHAAHNNYDQAIFGLRTVGENKMYFVSETGILTIVCVWVLAIIAYRLTTGPVPARSPAE